MVPGLEAAIKEIAIHQISVAINSALRIFEICISNVTWELGKKNVWVVKGFFPYFFGLLLTGKEIGIFTVMIVWKMKKSKIAIIATEAPGKVKKLGEYD